ncbi:hypothetical protein [Macrococcus animalis]|uniref:hypothetical protein n=1 Tax=Macrococcus animalis TaxID=3395467 RepID=UPI0039BE0088
MPKFNGIIIEGHSYTGKTSLFNELKKIVVMTNTKRSLIFITEHFTQIRYTNHTGCTFEISKQKHISLLMQHVDYLNNLSTWINDEIKHGKPSSDLFYMIERFHLNHIVHFGNNNEIIQIQNKIQNINPICILLTVSEKVMCERIKLRYPNINNEELHNELELFKSIQEKYINIAENSIVPYIIVNTDKMDWANIARKVYTTI